MTDPAPMEHYDLKGYKPKYASSQKKKDREGYAWLAVMVIAMVVLSLYMILHPKPQIAQAKEKPHYAPQIVDPAGALSGMDEFCASYRADKLALGEKPSESVTGVCKKYGV